MKNVVIVHGCPSNKEKTLDPETRTYDKHWIPWIKKELEKLDIITKTPPMPDPWEPVYEKFKKEFEKNSVNEESILIGHSCGCAFLVRWLGETKQKIHKLILVAPWKIASSGNALKKSFYEYDIDSTISSRVDEISMFTADDEEIDGKKSLEIFYNALGGQIIELKGYGHYTIGDMGTVEFPELLEQVIDFDYRKALIIPMNAKQEILIQDRRGYKKPDWGYFGGGIEKSETAMDAVLRETKEELDLDLTPDDLKYLGISVTNMNNKNIIRYMYLYQTDLQSFNVLEGQGALWLSFDEARERLEHSDWFDWIVSQIKRVL